MRLRIEVRVYAVLGVERLREGGRHMWAVPVLCGGAVSGWMVLGDGAVASVQVEFNLMIDRVPAPPEPRVECVVIRKKTRINPRKYTISLPLHPSRKSRMAGSPIRLAPEGSAPAEMPKTWSRTANSDSNGAKITTVWTLWRTRVESSGGPARAVSTSRTA